MGRSHPIKNGVWRSHLVPPAPKTSVFMGWDGPTSSHLLPKPWFLWGEAVPPRPTCSQNLSFHGVGRSHLVPPAAKTSVFMGWDNPTSSHLLPNPQFSWCGTIPPCPTCSQNLSFYGVKRSHLVPLVPKPPIFMGWDGPTLSHLLPNPQCHRVERSHLVPPAPKPLIFMGWDSPTSSHAIAVSGQLDSRQLPQARQPT